MFWSEDSDRSVHVKEILEQIEDMYTDLRMEYFEMAKSYDGLMDRISELESDKVYLEELLEEALAKGGADGL